jgi:hypothetical protein
MERGYTVQHYQMFTPGHIYTLRNRVPFLLVNSYMTWDITCASPILSVYSVCLQLYLKFYIQHYNIWEVALFDC